MQVSSLTVKKDQLQSYRPLSPELVENLENWFRVELTYTSNAIEGNTLSRRETALVVEKGLTVGGKTLKEHLEATNHVRAIDWVTQKIHQSKNDINEDDILKIHELILTGIDDKNAGVYRNIAVRISGSSVVLPNPRKVPVLMTDFCSWLSQTESIHPAERAAMAHYKLVTIHPFVDGNGRTARLLMNLILLRSGYPPAIIRTKDRLAYISSLERAQNGGSIAPYLRLIYLAVNRSLDIYLKAITGDESKQQVDQDKLYKIGEIAKATNESNSTIRHWTKLELIKEVSKTSSGYYLYSKETIARIALIHEMKKQRLSLEEIKQKLLKDDY